jgi:general secretion pathway protein H
MMPILVPGRNERFHHTGFTLLEMLVVLVIAGILLGAVALNAMPSDRQWLQREAQRIALLLQLARDEAIVRNQPVAFEADDYRYRFLIRREDKWQALTDDPTWREREFGRSPVHLSLSPAASQRLPVRISFGREPVDKAFVLTLMLAGQGISVQADGLGNFQVQ